MDPLGIILYYIIFYYIILYYIVLYVILICREACRSFL